MQPSKDQKVYFEKAFGCSRKMYNIYVDMLYAKLEEQNFVNGKIPYKSIKFPTPATIKKDYEYMKEIDSLAFANVQLDFLGAIKKYNNEYDGKSYCMQAVKQSKTLGKELTFKDLKGMPYFKSKNRKQNSFTTNNQNGTVSIVENNFVRIPKLKELIKLLIIENYLKAALLKVLLYRKTAKMNIIYHLQQNTMLIK